MPDPERNGDDAHPPRVEKSGWRAGLKRLLKRPETPNWIMVVLSILALFAGVSAVGTIVIINLPPSSPSPAASGKPPGSEMPSAAASSHESSESAPPGCYKGGEQVACSLGHDQEIFEAATCDFESLFRFMGGEERNGAPVDLLNDKLKVAPGPAQGTCQVSGIELSTERSLGSILTAEGAADTYRRCVEQGRLVGCDGPHQGEYFYRSKQDVDCRVWFEERYALTELTQEMRGQIEVRPQDGDSENNVLCIAIVKRSDEALTSSLRRVGPKPLPLGSR